METTKIKRFATTARIKLTQGVLLKLQQTGFDTRGNITDEPVLLQGGTMFRGRPISDESFYYRWQSLKGDIERYGVREVCERVAYTWFNRLAAIRILAKNGLIDPVIEYADHEMRIPQIVADARRGMNIPPMSDYDKLRWSHVAGNAAERDAQFLLLITAYCHSNPIIYRCFGGMQDYSELLLPDNILAKGEFVDMLNDAEAISDDDYRSPELIGWLYQFYISDRKSEVMDKKGQYKADEIPAATQIFTPNWIVKYMVQNTVGRIYLDNHPEAAEHFRPRWKYLVEPAQPSLDKATYKFKDLPELSLADFASGSGHILTECFDLLFDLYDYEDYSTREAVENIFTHNLTGIDIDTRAKQLATFALMLKACQRDRAFADAHLMPRVLDMPNVDRHTWEDLRGHMMNAHMVNLTSKKVNQELLEAFKLLEHADTLGSIIKFDISQETRDFILQCIDKQKTAPKYEEELGEMFKGFEIILALSEKYSAIIMNPPYMGSAHFDATLSKYVKDNYKDSKADLFAVFMQLAINRLADKGKYGMINMQSWMFLSSFEKLRHTVLEEQTIDSLLHLGPHTFDELNGEVVQNAAFVVTRQSPQYTGHFSDPDHPEIPSCQAICTRTADYFRLVNGRDCADKERMFLDAKANQTEGIYFPEVSQANFEKIPGLNFGYWASNRILNAFKVGQSIDDYSDFTGSQHITANNDIYLRFLWEIERTKKWKLYAKGGEFRKWYGNIEYVVDWSEEAINYYSNNKTSNQLAEKYVDQKGISYTDITSGGIGFRYFNGGAFDKSGPVICKVKHEMYFMGLLNSVVFKYVKPILNQTFHLQVKDIKSFPLIIFQSDIIDSIVKNNIAISREDWDAHETSWDFQGNELVDMTSDKYIDIMQDYGDWIGAMVDLAPPQLDSLKWRVDVLHTKWETQFERLHANEEELNSQFIDIYGLQDELTPDVPMDEVTILQQGEISIENNEIVWHDDVIMKQFISYAVGCMMGRYSIDKPGLILANQGDGLKEYEAQVPNSSFEVDDDGIIPLLPADCGFPDNARARIIDFLKTVFGLETLSQNLTFVEQCLGKTLEQYLIKDFWKDHKSRYQNRPIYWMFRSKRGAFQCVVYMHRMTQWTADQVRHKYLLPYIDNLRNRMQQAIDDRKQRTADKLRKAIDECEEYQERLKVVADRQIAFDLDDGVAKNYDLFGDVLAKI